MTKDEVYEYYLHWRKGSRTLSVEELFSAYTIDQNIFESSSKVINRLFYLVPDFFNSNLRIFIFYEENTFLKDSKQNLKLIQSNLKIQSQIASSSWTPSGRKLGLPQPLRLRKQCQGMLQRVLLECSTPDSSSEGC